MVKDNVIYLKDYLAVWLDDHFGHPLWKHADTLHHQCCYFANLNKLKQRTIKTNKRSLNAGLK